MYRAAVLMSTYNGEKYLSEQIESILVQEKVMIDLLIRDDGSTDNTKFILEGYRARHPNVKVEYGKNKGYKKSFLDMVFQVGRDEPYDYYAFADQDDVWKKNKIAEAIHKIDGIPEPVMYYSMMTQVDETLKVMAEQQERKKPLPKGMVLFQNFVQGSTIVFNFELYKIITEYKPEFNVAHDVWIPCLATYFGKVIFDTSSYILYRRHESSVTVNMNKGSYFRRLSVRFRNREKVDNLAIYLLKGYSGKMNGQDYKKLQYVAEYHKSLRNKFRCLWDSTLKKNSIRGTLVLKAAFVFNAIEMEREDSNVQ